MAELVDARMDLAVVVGSIRNFRWPPDFPRSQGGLKSMKAFIGRIWWQVSGRANRKISELMRQNTHLIQEANGLKVRNRQLVSRVNALEIQETKLRREIMATVPIPATPKPIVTKLPVKRKR